jgi:thiosulfate/3-mercaptopyruvate sulfurtransferase
MSYTTLICAQDLGPHIDEAGWRVFDVRHDLFDHAAGLRAYESGHIPGAQFAAIETELSGTKTGRNGRHPLPARDELVERFRAWGIDSNTQIVAYDTQGGQFAVRLWWLARWLGHSAVAVLDGGWPAWLAADGRSDTTRPVVARGNFSPAASLVRSVTTDDVLKTLDSQDRLLVDARLPERYRGEQEPIDPVAGHIPGALNRPVDTQPDAGPALQVIGRATERIRGPDRARPLTAVTHQCASGVTACHHVLAMEVAGLGASTLYAGSWSEWIADQSRPIRTGAQP